MKILRVLLVLTASFSLSFAGEQVPASVSYIKMCKDLTLVEAHDLYEIKNQLVAGLDTDGADEVFDTLSYVDAPSRLYIASLAIQLFRDRYLCFQRVGIIAQIATLSDADREPVFQRVLKNIDRAVESKRIRYIFNILRTPLTHDVPEPSMPRALSDVASAPVSPLESAAVATEGRATDVIFAPINLVAQTFYTQMCKGLSLSESDEFYVIRDQLLFGLPSSDWWRVFSALSEINPLERLQIARLGLNFFKRSFTWQERVQVFSSIRQIPAYFREAVVFGVVSNPVMQWFMAQRS